jgi:hypothetical protein
MDEDINFDGYYPTDDAPAEEPHVIPMPVISPEELLPLQTQAAQSVTLHEALGAAILDVQNLTTERDAVINREAALACSLHETKLNLEALNERLQNLITKKDVAVNEKAIATRELMNLYMV